MSPEELVDQYKEMHTSSQFSTGTALIKHIPEIAALKQPRTK